MIDKNNLKDNKKMSVIRAFDILKFNTIQNLF